MRQAITTKYLGPTNSRGSRVKATAAAGSITDSWNHAQNVDENHARVAQLLAAKFGWSGVWVAGGLPNDRGNVFVSLEGETYGAERQSAGRDDRLGIEGRDWFGLRPRA